MFIALGPNKTILLHRNEYVVQLERFIQTWHNELHNQKTARSRVLSPRVPRSNNSGLQYGVRSTQSTMVYRQALYFCKVRGFPGSVSAEFEEKER
jgi:hypothetical protein